jgi:Asp-tRNA(Asn)/Glu-tRNA(Gln) amidotransferase A subunit family amidase
MRVPPLSWQKPSDRYSSYLFLATISLPGFQNLNCAMFNQTGHPALVMPIGMLAPVDGPADLKLPISLQIIGKHWDELTVYRTALALEDHLGNWRVL